MKKSIDKISLASITDLDHLIKVATRESDCVSFNQLSEILNSLEPLIQNEVVKDSNIIADALCAAEVSPESIKLIETALKDIITTIVNKEVVPLDFSASVETDTERDE